MFIFVFFKQKTAYEMRISDCSSDVCASDLVKSFSIDQQVSDLGIQAIAFVVPGITVPAETSPALNHEIETSEKSILAATDPKTLKTEPEFKTGRASCRERVCQYV